MARAIDGTVEVSRQGDVRRHYIKGVVGECLVTPDHVVRVVDAALASEVSAAENWILLYRPA
jgi:hypothetical protein